MQKQTGQLLTILVLPIVLTACGGGGGNSGGSTPPALPTLSISNSLANEGNSGKTSIAFTVMLSAVDSSDVTVHYDTQNGTAVAGSDYDAASGTLTILTGNTTATLTVMIAGDTTVETDETFSVVLSNPSANATIANATATGTIINDDIAPPPPPPTSVSLNDTGMQSCGNESSNGLACADAAQATDQFPNQDAQHGRDVTDNHDADGHAGFSFVKLDTNGVALSDQSVSYTTTPWSCVQDQVTGLMWEVKTSDAGLRDAKWDYTWFNSTGINSGMGGLNRGVSSGGQCSSSDRCDSEKYVEDVNVLQLCGKSDWRLPNRTELLSLVDYGTSAAPLIDSKYFPNTAIASYWSETPGPLQNAWMVDYRRGTARVMFSTNAMPIRLVRGGN
jgi:hypothetical protein